MGFNPMMMSKRMNTRSRDYLPLNLTQIFRIECKVRRYQTYLKELYMETHSYLIKVLKGELKSKKCINSQNLHCM